MTAHEQPLDYAERWMGDALAVANPPGGFGALEVDMSRALDLLERERVDGRRESPTALYVRAAAMTLTRHPRLHQMIVGNRRYRYDQVDIALSVAGRTAMAPRLLLRDAGRKTWQDLAREIHAFATTARHDASEEWGRLRRWGWILPLGALRRAALRWLRTRPGFRAAKMGTFQVTVMSDIDVGVPFIFGTAAILSAGGVRERVVAREGQPVVRPTVYISSAFNHHVWDGLAAKQFMDEVKSILESADFIK